MKKFINVIWVLIYLLISCEDDKSKDVDITSSGKWYTTSVKTTNYDSNNRIVENPKVTVSDIIVDSLSQYYSDDFISTYSLEFLNDNKLRISTPSPSLYFDYDYEVKGNKIIVDFTHNNISEFEYKIEKDILTLVKKKEYNDINPAAVNPNIKYSIEVWKLKK